MLIDPTYELWFADANGAGNPAESDNSAGKASSQVKGLSLVLKQFHALLVKRFHHATRSHKDFLAQVCLLCYIFCSAYN